MDWLVVLEVLPLSLSLLLDPQTWVFPPILVLAVVLSLFLSSMIDVHRAGYADGIRERLGNLHSGKE